MLKTTACFAFAALALAGCVNAPPATTTHQVDALRQQMIDLREVARDLDLTYEEAEYWGARMLRGPEGVEIEVNRDYPTRYWFNRVARPVEYPHIEFRDGLFFVPIGFYNSLAIDLGRADKVRILDGLAKPTLDGVSYEPEKVEAGTHRVVVKPTIKPADLKATAPKPLAGKTIVLDAGHGGKDPGGIGVDGIQEKGIALNVTLLVQKQLKELGANVILTRKDDTFIELSDRASIANNAKADFFVSIHANMAGEHASGIETWFQAGESRGEKSQTLSKAINDALVRSTGAVDRGARADQRGLHVLRNTNMPACLVELGFMSNAEEGRKLASKEYQAKLAAAVVKGITTYAGAASA